MTNPLTRALLAEGAAHGVTLTAAADQTDQDAPGVVYAVDGPAPDTRRTHTDDQAAAADIRHRLDSLQDAADAAAQRAARWTDLRRSAADQITAWCDLAAEVNAALPDGCDIPTPDHADLYGVNGWPPMTAVVADTLARWTAAARDRAARERLAVAVAAEGAALQDSTDQTTRRPDYWQTVVDLWQPLQVVRDPGDRPTVRQGRVLADTDTRRVIAWRHYGVAVAEGTDAVDAAAAQLERARAVVADAAQQHRAAADRLADSLHL